MKQHINFLHRALQPSDGGLQNKKRAGFLFGPLLNFIVFITAMCFIASLCSCTKQADYSYLNSDRTGTYEYQMVVDWHSLDTTVLYYRYTQDLGKLKEADVKTWREMWYVSCDMLDRLQHLYYRKITK